ncbi:TPA: hypothetical protein ACHKTP_005177 [Escherichia coli]
MMYHILMEIKRIRYIRDIVLDSDNDYTEIIVHYRCKTPLNEFDTCAMICRYFESVYFEDESGETFFTPKKTVVELWSEMVGVIRCRPDSRSLSLKPGNEIIIPIIYEIEDKLRSGKYDPDEFDTEVFVRTWLGDLFDQEGNILPQ